jgi:hypothetical protein
VLGLNPSASQNPIQEVRPCYADQSAALAGLEPEADLQDDLELGDLAVPDDAPLVHHLEPVEVAKRLGGFGYRVLRRLPIAIVGHAAELDDLERLLGHGLLLVA